MGEMWNMMYSFFKDLLEKILLKNFTLGSRVVYIRALMSNIKELCMILGSCWCFRAQNYNIL